MDNKKLKNYYKCMCIILLCSPLKAYHVSSLNPNVIIGSSTTLKSYNDDSVASSSPNCFYLIWMRVHPKRRTMDVINVDGHKYKTQYNEQTKSCDLIITTATLEDTGMYYCSETDARPFIGIGTKLTVVGNDGVILSVEVFSPSEFLDPNIPLICWATNTLPSQVRVFWVVNGKEHIGWTESVWSKQSDQTTTEFTQSRFWLSKADWEAGGKCTCVVEAGGRNVSKSIQRVGNDMCLFLVYGISCAAFCMIFVAITTVLVLREGHGVKEVREKDRRRLNTDKHGKYTKKRSSLTEVQYASLDNIRQPQ
ncbi:uncharacterized protein LOC125285756 [Alosa alosa]|nr:uncharacterized protein LOC125285756 [Alosa alosa]